MSSAAPALALKRLIISSSDCSAITPRQKRHIRENHQRILCVIQTIAGMVNRFINAGTAVPSSIPGLCATPGITHWPGLVASRQKQVVAIIWVRAISHWEERDAMWTQAQAAPEAVEQEQAKQSAQNR
jgi:hypothetical protein